MESDTLNNSPKTTLFIMEIVVGTCTLYIYIICGKPILQIRSVLRMPDCSKISTLGRSIKHVTLVDYLTQRGLVLPCEAMAFNLKYTVTDAFRVRLGDAERDGWVSEAGRDVDKDLASTSKLRPRCTRCPYLESWVRQKKRRKPKLIFRLKLQVEQVGIIY